jgi:hypothetical protein
MGVFRQLFVPVDVPAKKLQSVRKLADQARESMPDSLPEAIERATAKVLEAAKRGNSKVTIFGYNKRFIKWAKSEGFDTYTYGEYVDLKW